MDYNFPWIPPCLLDAEVDDQKCYITGYVKTKEDHDTVLEAHKRATFCTFVAWSDDINKKEKTTRRILWKYGDINNGNIPFTVNRSIVTACQYGKGRKKTPENNENTVNESDHEYGQNNKRKSKMSKKVGCEAKLSVHYMTRYPEYSVENDAGRIKRQIKLDVLNDHLKTREVLKEEVIYLKLPLMASHTNHDVTECGVENSMHPNKKACKRQKTDYKTEQTTHVNNEENKRQFSGDLSLEDVRRLQDEFCVERNWGQYHTPRNLLLAMVGEVGELSEIFQWKGEVKTGLPDFTDGERKHVGQEISDILIYLIRFADKCNIDLPQAVLQKIEHNKQKYPVDKVYGKSDKYTAYK